MSYRVNAPRLLRAAALIASCLGAAATPGCHFDCSLNCHPIFSSCDTGCDQGGVYGCDDAGLSSHLFGDTFSAPPEQPEHLPWPRFHPVPARPVFEPPPKLPVAPSDESPLPVAKASFQHPIDPPVVAR